MPAIQSRYHHVLKSITRLFSHNSTPPKNVNAATNQTSVLICGLGNLDYPETRHSVGMKAMDHLAVKLYIPWTKRCDLKSYVAEKLIEIPNKDGNSVSTTGELISVINLVLLKPTIPMNLNGKSVLKAAKFYNTEPKNIFLVHDELEKKVGKYRMKHGGSARGHNGVKSVAECFQTDAMSRLLIGIDRPSNKDDVADYVLSPWEEKEKEIVESQMGQYMKLLLKSVEEHFGDQFKGQIVKLLD